MKMQPETKYGEYLINNWKSVSIALVFLVTVVANSHHIEQNFPTYQSTWTCEYNQSQLRVTGDTNLYTRITGGGWHEGPLQVEYRNYTTTMNVTSWQPNRETCIGLATIINNQ